MAMASNSCVALPRAGLVLSSSQSRLCNRRDRRSIALELPRVCHRGLTCNSVQFSMLTCSHLPVRCAAFSSSRAAAWSQLFMCDPPRHHPDREEVATAIGFRSRVNFKLRRCRAVSRINFLKKNGDGGGGGLARGTSNSDGTTDHDDDDGDVRSRDLRMPRVYHHRRCHYRLPSMSFMKTKRTNSTTTTTMVSGLRMKGGGEAPWMATTAMAMAMAAGRVIGSGSYGVRCRSVARDGTVEADEPEDGDGERQGELHEAAMAELQEGLEKSRKEEVVLGSGDDREIGEAISRWDGLYGNLQKFPPTFGRVDKDEFVLPIMPMRMVKFPSESISLQLFEPRYRSMFKLVYQSKMKQFGVVWADRLGATMEGVGVICQINRFFKVPESGRILVNSVAISRFRAKSVIFDKPFITAVVERIDDGDAATLAEHMELAILERRVWQCMQDVRLLAGKLYGHLGSLAQEEVFSQEVLTWRPSQEEKGVGSTRVVDHEGNPLSEERRREMFSFAVARTLDEISLDQQQSLLYMTSTAERLRACDSILSEGRKYLAARSTLRDIFY